MHQIWNLKTQLATVFLALLLGSLLVQNWVHERSKDRLLRDFQSSGQEIADQVTETVLRETQIFQPQVTIRPRPHGLRTLRRPPGQTSATLGQVQIDISEIKKAQVRLLLHMAYKFHVKPETSVLPSDLTYQSDSVLAAEPEVAPEAPEHSDLLGSATYPQDSPEMRLEVRRVRSEALASSEELTLSGDSPSKIDISKQLNEIQQVFDEYRRADLLATVAIFVVGIAVALYMSFRLTRPVYHVVSAFDRVSRGDLSTRVSESGAGEFSVLNRQFNRMVESLAEHQALERELAKRERIQHMGDLAAGVAHDVRNPLNAIHLNVGQIRDEFMPEDTRAKERFSRFTSDIQSEVTRLNQLVTNFLSLAQPSQVESEWVSPCDLIEELVRLLKKEAARNAVQLRTSFADSLPPFYCDRQEIKSAFLNVAMNALQAMESEGGVLEITASLDGSPEEEKLVVAFRDSGRGINRDDLDRVFLPYFTTRPGGTGLGLAIARKIAERHEGVLELESEPGAGTTVRFAFALSAEPCELEGGAA